MNNPCELFGNYCEWLISVATAYDLYVHLQRPKILESELGLIILYIIERFSTKWPTIRPLTAFQSFIRIILEKLFSQVTMDRS